MLKVSVVCVCECVSITLNREPEAAMTQTVNNYLGSLKVLHCSEFQRYDVLAWQAIKTPVHFCYRLLLSPTKATCSKLLVGGTCAYRYIAWGSYFVDSEDIWDMLQSFPDIYRCSPEESRFLKQESCGIRGLVLAAGGNRLMV